MDEEQQGLVRQVCGLAQTAKVADLIQNDLSNVSQRSRDKRETPALIYQP